ncbi:MAG: histidine kinase, partial [Myxococcota bacterium]
MTGMLVLGVRIASGHVDHAAGALAFVAIWTALGTTVSALLFRFSGLGRAASRRRLVVSGLANAWGGTFAMTLGLALVGVGVTGVPPTVASVAGTSLVVGSAFMVWTVGVGALHLHARAHEGERRLLALAGVAAKARLDALRYQLNPHFLFNALNALSTTIDEDPSRAQRMILDLSALLRAALDADGTGTLGDEVTRLARYLRLERARFEDALDVTIDIPESLRGAPCLPLLLQPLVENAIKHGSGADGPRVRIEAQLRGAFVVVRVANPGRWKGPRGAGVGLDNTRQRLALFDAEGWVGRR